MFKVGIIGATGYTGEEIIKILSTHSRIKITHLSAVLDKEEPISNIFPSLKGRVDVICEKPDAEKAKDEVDIIFLALPHRVSMEFAPTFLRAKKKVVDLSADYRLSPDAYKVWYGIEHKDKGNIQEAVYGLSEIYRDEIKNASLIANPGCYPTSVVLALAPLIREMAVERECIIADSKSGVTGAGRRPDLALSFGEVNENMKAYKINEHQHKPEINKILSSLAGEETDVIFTPHLVPMNRGILSTIYVRLKKKLELKAALNLYKNFYSGRPFVRIYDEGKFPQIRNVVGTNFCDIGIKITGGACVLVSCIDNLLKGAAGQAVQNMNIMCGFDETEGLI
ncbi:MAG: N-acetyl-gamma-glutamyl-phosphate reductase [Omnitrophica bacterium RIFCSPLOWO2_01_FULL_45_10]|nr:MAG: N-acetyl-gamma-glutamyl-phosphate reductase [Omnitrophica bacterium RIFCSPLOWO2_01_FULL_45_10]